MDQVLTDNIWKQITAEAKACKQRVAAIAYVSTDTRVKFKRGDILVCDASDAAIKSGETSARVLAKWHKIGVRIYSRPGLHAKILVMGNKALIGSANLSESSALHLREAALLTNRSEVVSQAKAFIYLVMNEAIEVDSRFIVRAEHIKVSKRKPVSVPARKRHKTLGTKCWIVRVTEMAPSSYEKEIVHIEDAEEQLQDQYDDDLFWLSWIRFTGKSRFRNEARPGDTVIVLSATQSEKRISVSPPSAILLRQDEQHWTRFYHTLPLDQPEISWTAFQRKLKKLGITHITKNSCKELSKKDASLIQTIWEA